MSMFHSASFIALCFLVALVITLNILFSLKEAKEEKEIKRLLVEVKEKVAMTRLTLEKIAKNFKEKNDN